jgi:hypothetical protein
MSVDWVLTRTAGGTCGQTSKRKLSQSYSTGSTSITLANPTTLNWNEELTTAILSGSWDFTLKFTVTNNGTDPTVQLLVQRVNSSCVVQETPINSTTTLSASGGDQTWSPSFSLGAIAAGNYTIVSVNRTAGTATTALKYGGASGGTNDSHFLAPNRGNTYTPSPIVLELIRPKHKVNFRPSPVQLRVVNPAHKFRLSLDSKKAVHWHRHSSLKHTDLTQEEVERLLVPASAGLSIEEAGVSIVSTNRTASLALSVGGEKVDVSALVGGAFNIVSEHPTAFVEAKNMQYEQAVFPVVGFSVESPPHVVRVTSR